MKNIEALEDQDVGLTDRCCLTVDDVVDDVTVDGCFDDRLSTLEVAKKLQQSSSVVTLGKALAIHDPALVKDAVRLEETVSRDQIDFRVIRPASEQSLKNSSKRALADGHASCNTDHVRHLGGKSAEKCRTDLVQVLCRRNVEIQETSEGQIDRRNLFEVDLLVDTAQPFQVGLAQGQWRRCAEFCPLGSGETLVTLTNGQ